MPLARPALPRALRAIAAVLALATPGLAAAEDLVTSAHAITVRSDLVYGQGTVGASGGKPHLRDLRLDLYQPLEAGKPMAARPAVVLAFGGAFLRGAKGPVHFEEDGANDSSMADWCAVLARAGTVCLAIEYRLATEDPGLARQPDPATMMPRGMLSNPVLMARTEVIRARMGLPPLDDASRAQYLNTVFAAAEDMGAAVDYARAHAAELGIDPARIAVGGFSAGAVTAANFAYGAQAPGRVPVRAVVSFSGGAGGYDLARTVKPGMPPALLVMGQNDLPGVMLANRMAIGALKAAGVPLETAWVPDFGHFYPMGAVTLGADMTRASLEARVLAFLARTL
jgi:acetyl esterase/lipase